MARKLKDEYAEHDGHLVCGDATVRALPIVQHVDDDDMWWPTHMAPDECYEPEKPEPGSLEWTMDVEKGRYTASSVLHDEGSPFAYGTHPVGQKWSIASSSPELLGGVENRVFPGLVDAQAACQAIEDEIIAKAAKAKPAPVIRWKMLTTEGKSPFAKDHGGITVSYPLPSTNGPGEWKNVPLLGCYACSLDDDGEARLCAGGRPAFGIVLAKLECEDRNDRRTDFGHVKRYNRVRILEIVPWSDCPSEDWKAVAKKACPELFEDKGITPPERVPDGYEWTGEWREPVEGEDDAWIQRDRLGCLARWDTGHFPQAVPDKRRYILRKLPEIAPPADGKWQETHRWDGGEKRLPKDGEAYINDYTCPKYKALIASYDFVEGKAYILIPLTTEELQARDDEAVLSEARKYIHDHCLDGDTWPQHWLAGFHKHMQELARKGK